MMGGGGHRPAVSFLSRSHSAFIYFRPTFAILMA